MAGISRVRGIDHLNYLFNGAAPRRISRIWMSLHTDDPGGLGLHEVSGHGYARVEVTHSFPDALDPRVSNNVRILFPEATSPYDATHIGFWDASSDDDEEAFVYGQALTAVLHIATGAPPDFPPGSIAIYTRYD
ncbi:MAG TPA: hypothetical protein VGE45_00285 [Chloroflexia bacterium]|jgi:hypothetical protein